MHGLDTAYNYQGFTSHRALADVGADLLDEFTLSTKVGYFPGAEPGEPSVHTLDPIRIGAAVERSAHELGRRPDVVFLHNPELALTGRELEEGRDTLAAACASLTEAVNAGTCSGWGIATWDPRAVVAVLERDSADFRPGALLVRSGLTVASPILTAAERLRRALDVPSSSCWGMSPFGGRSADPVWSTVDLRAFIADDASSSTPQRAFRLAYEIPSVTRVLVGTRRQGHLSELVAATRLGVRPAAIRRYRELIQESAPVG